MGDFEAGDRRHEGGQAHFAPQTPQNEPVPGDAPARQVLAAGVVIPAHPLAQRPVLGRRTHEADDRSGRAGDHAGERIQTIVAQPQAAGSHAEGDAARGQHRRGRRLGCVQGRIPAPLPSRQAQDLLLVE